MNEQEVLKQFIDDYQKMDLGQLRTKYEGDEYWDIISTSHILKYLKDNNLMSLMVDKDSNANYYTALTQHQKSYRVTISHDQKWFESLEDAVISKLQYLTSNIFSSLRRK